MLLCTTDYQFLAHFLSIRMRAVIIHFIVILPVKILLLIYKKYIGNSIDKKKNL